MDLKEHKSALATLATLGVTAVAAGATAFVRVRRKRREALRQQEAADSDTTLSAEQMMVYNEAISAFLSINDRLYELRRQRDRLQPLVRRLALKSSEPLTIDGDAADDVVLLAKSIEKFLATQVPFVNACLAAVDEQSLSYADCVRGPVGGSFDSKLDEEPTGAAVADGERISYVLRLGYYFPDSTIAPHPVRSIVLTQPKD